MALAVLLSGCSGAITITSVDLNSNTDAGSNHLVTLHFSVSTDATDPVHAVFAIRVPEAWEVKSVSLTGAFTGLATRSAVMEAAYATDWESATGVGYNGHKDGYKWWVGYSQPKTWSSGDMTHATFAIDTKGRGGTYQLDFVTGFAMTLAPPEDPANKDFWMYGSFWGDPPTGMLLDQSITLYAFRDVHPGAAYYEAIQGMASRGLIEGYPADTGGFSDFRPLNSVYRAQFAKMIVGALGLAVNEAMTAPVNFSDLGADVADNLYPHEYVWTAYSNNIIKGYTDGSFRPYTAISRGHVVTMIVRALQAKYPAAVTPAPDSYVQTWGNDLPPEHKTNAAVAEYNDLLAGLPISTTASSGNASMPRGEVAQVLWNMMTVIAGP